MGFNSVFKGLRVTQNSVWLHVWKITRTMEDERLDTAADTEKYFRIAQTK